MQLDSPTVSPLDLRVHTTLRDWDPPLHFALHVPHSDSFQPKMAPLQGAEWHVRWTSGLAVMSKQGLSATTTPSLPTQVTERCLMPPPQSLSHLVQGSTFHW